MSRSTTDFGDEGGVKIRSSRALAERHREAQDHEEALRHASERALGTRNAAVLDDPPPVRARDPQTELTMLEAQACGLVRREQLRTLEQCHGTPEHAVQLNRILEVLQARYNVKRRYWPKCADGPLLPGPNGLLVPAEIRDRELALLVLRQLKETALQRELRRHERLALRALKRNGVRDASDVRDVQALERARLKRLSKGAKRARAAQAMMASARAHAEPAAEPQEAAC